MYLIGLVRRQEALWREAWAGVQSFFLRWSFYDGFFSYFMYLANNEIKHVHVKILRCAHFNKTKKSRVILLDFQ